MSRVSPEVLGNAFEGISEVPCGSGWSLSAGHLCRYFRAAHESWSNRKIPNDLDRLLLDWVIESVMYTRYVHGALEIPVSEEEEVYVLRQIVLYRYLNRPKKIVDANDYNACFRLAEGEYDVQLKDGETPFFFAQEIKAAQDAWEEAKAKSKAARDQT